MPTLSTTYVPTLDTCVVDDVLLPPPDQLQKCVLFGELYRQ